MNLIPLLKLIPLRDETGKIYKWEEEANLFSPLQILRVRFEKNLDKVEVILVNGERVIVDETLKEVDSKFARATGYQ